MPQATAPNTTTARPAPSRTAYKQNIAKKLEAFTKWNPPDDLVRLSACYQALCLASDGIASIGGWRCAEGADEVQDWSEAIDWLVEWAAKVAEQATPCTSDELAAVRLILTNWHERCGATTTERLATLGRLAVIEDEIERRDR